MYDSSVVDCAIPLKNRKTGFLAIGGSSNLYVLLHVTRGSPSPSSAGRYDTYMDTQQACYGERMHQQNWHETYGTFCLNWSDVRVSQVLGHGEWRPGNEEDAWARPAAESRWSTRCSHAETAAATRIRRQDCRHPPRPGEASFLGRKLSNAVWASYLCYSDWVLVRSLSLQLCVTPRTAAGQAHLRELAQTHVHWAGDAIHHLILCRPLLPPSTFQSIRVFSNESALQIRWPKDWSFSISPSNGYSELIQCGWSTLKSYLTTV